MSNLISVLPARVDYELWQGDTWEPGTIAVTVSGTALNLTGYTARMDIKSAVTNTTALTLTNGSGITMTSGGIITLAMTAAQTNDLSGEYTYDLQITDTSSKKRTYTYGIINVSVDTTDN